MIKFFRKIRERLLAENKFRSYLFYAIGEIILVVIGILIAVAINARYTAHQNEMEFRNILTQIQTDLITDIKDAKRIVNYRLAKDSMARKIYYEYESLKKYKNDPFSIDIAWNYVSFTTQKGGYHRLMQNLENLPERYNILIPAFNNLHVEIQNDVDDYNSAIKTEQSKFGDEIFQNPKAADYYLENYTPEETFNFIYNDPQLKNRTMRYMGRLSNISLAAQDYSIEARNLFQKIDSIKGTKSADLLEIVDLIQPKEDLLPFVGGYVETGGRKMNDEEISIKIEEGGLVLTDLMGEHNLYLHQPYFYYMKWSSYIYEFYINDENQHCLKISDSTVEKIFTLKSDM